MVDLTKILDDLDLSAVVLPDDKLDECDYFFGLLKKENNRDKFRWLLGAYLNACYGYLEYKAAYFHYAHCDPETGEPIKDWESLDTLRKYVRVFQQRKSGFVKTSGLSQLMEKLYKFRATSTHDGGIGIMETGSNLPEDFQIGVYTREGVPAIEFCLEVRAFFAELEHELDGL